MTEDARLPWNSLSLVGRTASGNASLWKLFSREGMPHAWLEMIFERGAQGGALQGTGGEGCGKRQGCWLEHGCCLQWMRAWHEVSSMHSTGRCAHTHMHHSCPPSWCLLPKALRWWLSGCGMPPVPTPPLTRRRCACFGMPLGPPAHSGTYPLVVQQSATLCVHPILPAGACAHHPSQLAQHSGWWPSALIPDSAPTCCRTLRPSSWQMGELLGGRCNGSVGLALLRHTAACRSCF